MQFASIREFKINATRYLKQKEELVITRRKEPIAVLSPIEKESMRAALLRMGQIFKETKISKKEALKALEQARREVYASRRP
jgi:antitoxin (DNA-binding transcriptional repressor) of toxin-antitoxin stability system